jgi:Flp pilus assembly protein TadG
MSQLRGRRDGLCRLRSEEGQSLLETAFAMPLMLGIGFNLINISYFWIMLLALSAAPRQGVQYATQGGSALASVTAPGTTAISNLVYENVTNAIKGATTSNLSVRVCTTAKGVNPSTGVALCDQFGPAFSFSGPAADPEEPVFVLDRVDVAYTVTPVIQGALFNIVLPAGMIFHRQVSMRSLF